ncbi:Kinesin light chain [Plasmopara halstedii]|uniref:Kinesin light chain n=1 Tax=Plasmopara halstedii TaxID=4781 RepID=A0A0P1AF21_PLAHL|nr:Kinesin light chain [Plasmopara halstedii]CEG39374.1 Kinesin light chain [Plasmopara halstedii]|eukprot:XP_024575743.1 Kinesin light chain [Plasmopara halstedii]
MNHRLVLVASTSLRRHVLTASTLQATKHFFPLRWSSNTSSIPLKPSVQVLHNKPQTSYVQVEQNIASMQREIRDAYNSGDYQAALEVGFQCRDLVKSHFGENHPVYASTITNIALMYKNLGQTEEAIESYEFALQTYKASVGEQHASFATTLYNLGLVYRSLSISTAGMERVTALHRALECFEESLKIRREILEPGHADIALSMSNIGVIYWQNKQPDKAFAALIEAVDLLEKKVGANSVLTALAKNNLAFAKKEAREYDEAIKLYKEVLSVRKQKLGQDHNETIIACHNLAEAYRSSGNEDKAVHLQNEILDLFDGEVGSNRT